MATIKLGTVTLKETKYGYFDETQPREWMQKEFTTTYQYQARDEAKRKGYEYAEEGWKLQRRPDGKGPWKDAEPTSRYSDNWYHRLIDAKASFIALAQQKATGYAYEDPFLAHLAEQLRQNEAEAVAQNEAFHQKHIREFAKVADTFFVEANRLYLQVGDPAKHEEKLTALELTPEVLAQLKGLLAEAG
jgi:hypothetical protein